MKVQENNIGLIEFNFWCDHGDTLKDQLTKASIPFDKIDVPHLTGMAGCAYVLMYTSPNTKKDIAVLCVPVRYEIDGFAEEYFYFEKTKEDALKSEQYWLDIYDECKRLTKPDLSNVKPYKTKAQTTRKD